MRTFLLVVQFLTAVALIAVVVLQPSKGEGLGAIGGGGQMFFNKAKGFEATLTRITTGVAIGFLVLNVLLLLV